MSWGNDTYPAVYFKTTVHPLVSVGDTSPIQINLYNAGLGSNEKEGLLTYYLIAATNAWTIAQQPAAVSFCLGFCEAEQVNSV